MLDPIDQLDLYSLHYVYLPRINSSLRQFEEGWNHHGIRTAAHKSPHQLFAAGALQLQRSGLRGLDFFSAVGEHYGVEEVGLPPEEGDGEVTFNENRFTLESGDFTRLRALVNPLKVMELTCTGEQTLFINHQLLYPAIDIHFVYDLIHFVYDLIHLMLHNSF